MKKNYVPGCPCPDCIKVFTTRVKNSLDPAVHDAQDYREIGNDYDRG